MGILGLSKLIADVAPGSIKENEIKNYFGKCNEYKNKQCINKTFVFTILMSILERHR